jgi:hypothetical protein
LNNSLISRKRRNHEKQQAKPVVVKAGEVETRRTILGATTLRMIAANTRALSRRHGDSLPKNSFEKNSDATGRLWYSRNVGSPLTDRYNVLKNWR